MSSSSVVRVAVTQHEPAWLDLQEGVRKTCSIIEQAATGGAKLVAFPETWIPGYPCWIWSRPVDMDLGTRYVKNSLAIDSPEMETICEAARKNKIAVALGFSENDADSLYISQVLIDDAGIIKMRRRKMKPTHMERTIFGDASGECLANVVTTPIGRIGSLSCWEHIQPLLKYHVMAQKEQIHIAAWPVLGTFDPASPVLWSMTSDGCSNLSQTYAVEGQAYVLHVSTVLSEAGLQLMKTTNSPLMGQPIKGSSAIYGPDGRKVDTGDNVDEQLIFANLDLDEVVKLKTFADASGHYSRPDLLWLGADASKKSVVRMAGSQENAEASPDNAYEKIS